MFPRLDLPRWLIFLGIFGAVAGLIPIGLIARFRQMPSKLPRIHIIQDMDNQGRYKSQQANALFADNRASRTPVPGTVPRGWLRADAHFETGTVGDDYASEFPMQLSNAMMQRGRRQYDIYCTPCHGLAGDGDGIVNVRAEEMQQGNWVPPASLHDTPYSERPVGHYFNTITNGIRNMPAYGTMLSVEDRWAIVAYVKALQLSQNASLDTVPASERGQLEQVN